ncbi:hypothetical protein [Nocardia fusca]|uniref:Uncharacterized protein n=1 Tax=Nocardia fusca TaxID=941183 RepID=A0ABV3FEL1_9NOCA
MCSGSARQDLEIRRAAEQHQPPPHARSTVSESAVADAENARPDNVSDQGRRYARRDPAREAAEAEAAADLRTTRCRMEFSDIGAVVWILRKCVWWVPDFSVDRYRDTLVELDREMRDGHPFVAFSTRHLIDAVR